MFGFFGWLRQTAKNAVLGGVADALDELDPAGNTTAPANLERLRSLVTTEAKALPVAKEADEQEPAGKRKK